MFTIVYGEDLNLYLCDVLKIYVGLIERFVWLDRYKWV